MRWSELKVIIIVILVAANIFFAADLMYLSADKKENVSDKMNETIIKVLEEDGITLPRSLLDGEITEDVPVYVCDGAQDYTDEIRMRLTGTSEWVYDKNENDGRTIQVGDGSQFFFGKDRSFKYLRLEYDMIIEQVLAESDFSDVDESTTSETEEYLKKMLIPHGDNEFSLSLNMDSLVFSGSTKCMVAVVSETLVCKDSEGDRTHDLFGNRLVCIISGGKLIYADGKWLFSPVSEVRTAQNSPLVNILLSVKKTVGKQRENGDTAPVAVVKIDHTYCTYVDIFDGKAYIMPGRETLLDNGMHIVANSISSEIYECCYDE